MNADSRPVLHLLADGEFHSGERLAEQMGCTRAAVWKRLKAIQESTGLEIDAVPGRGYRLTQPIELLDETAIREALSPAARAIPCPLLLQDVTFSTNALALAAIEKGGEVPAAWFAEYQQGGRGRRGRRWHAPYGRNLCLSLAWRFDLPMQQLPGLSIAVGVAIAEVLEACGLRGHGLKWPNDVHWKGGKLAGILVEAGGETGGPAHAVIGVGLNLDLGGALPDWLDQPVTDLRTAGVQPGRNRLAGLLLDALLLACTEYADSGLVAFLERWRRFDLYRGKPVILKGGGETHRGVAMGLGSNGELRLETEQGERVFYGGELSLRPERRE